jgi:hypothetical protein
MDRLAELSADLKRTLDELNDEAIRRNVRELMPPLAWLEEANRWLAFELDRLHGGASRDPVPFTYIAVDLRK